MVKEASFKTLSNLNKRGLKKKTKSQSSKFTCLRLFKYLKNIYLEMYPTIQLLFYFSVGNGNQTLCTVMVGNCLNVRFS